MGEAVRPHHEFEMWNTYIDHTTSLLEQLKGELNHNRWFLYFYPPFTRKRQGRCAWDESRLAYRSGVCFPVFRLSFASDFCELLLVKFHQAEIIIVKHLIHGRNNEAGVGVVGWVRVEPSTLRS